MDATFTVEMIGTSPAGEPQTTFESTHEAPSARTAEAAAVRVAEQAGYSFFRVLRVGQGEAQ